MGFPDAFDRLESAHPHLADYLAAFAAFIKLPLPIARARFRKGVAARGYARLDAACRAWEDAGVLPPPPSLSSEQVVAIWQSPIFELAEESVLQFFPPSDTDLRHHTPAPCATWADLGKRAFLTLEESPYWHAVLSLNLPEFYLIPYLPSGRKLVGCDMASGWGRVALTLPGSLNATVYCVDSTPRNLTLLTQLAKNAERTNVIPTQGDVTNLPFEANTFDFFTAFDIFEHLEDVALDKTLREILRTARPGAILYTETPIRAYCPAVTHVQDFSGASFILRLTNTKTHGRRFELVLYAGEQYEGLNAHFSFRVV